MTQSDNVNVKKLFGTSGVRGIINQELDYELMFNLGRSIATSLPPQARALIATDSRLSREYAKSTISSGMMASGMHVLDTAFQAAGNDPSLLGIFPTPVLAFLTKELGVEVGVMITASHNPSEYNGFKFFNPDGIGYSNHQENTIQKIYYQKNFREGIPGKYTKEISTKKRFFNHIKSKYKFKDLNKQFRILIDPGNGAASKFVSDLFRDLGLEIFTINDSADGSFPGRSPEPGPDTLQQTYQYLKSINADLAICFDGDADRVVFIDRYGFIGFDEAVTYLAFLEVKSSGKQRVVSTVEAGRLLDLALKPLEVEIIRGTVGDVPVAYLTRENDAAIGIEPVGVYIYPDPGYYPASIYAALNLIKSIANVSEIREFFQGIPQLFKLQKKITCPNELKSDVLKYVMDNSRLLGKGSKNTIDGIRIDYENKWILIRPSGTEPVIRIIVEALSMHDAEELLVKASIIVQDYVKSIHSE